MRPIYSNELLHYRTPGSKNGVRLYQYEDGSLTPLGRQHYGVGSGQESRIPHEQRLQSRPSYSSESSSSSSGTSHQDRIKSRQTYENHFSNPKSIFRGEFVYGYRPNQMVANKAANGSYMIPGYYSNPALDEEAYLKNIQNAKDIVREVLKNGFDKLKEAGEPEVGPNGIKYGTKKSTKSFGQSVVDFVLSIFKKR